MKICVFFKMCILVPYYDKKFEDQKNYIMKIKRSFMKVVLLNEVFKHHLFKPNFDLGRIFTHFRNSILFNKHMNP
jgi:hypothetical protein